MNVRMMEQALPPGVQYTQKANLRAQMFWIGGDLTQRLRHRPEQDVENHLLVLKGNDFDRLGQREYLLVVGHIEQFRPTVLQPLSACESLALWTAFVTTRVVPDTLMAAFAALLDVTAKRSGPAILDRADCPPPPGRQRRAMPIKESRAEVAEHVRHFQSRSGHDTRASGGHEVRRGWYNAVQSVQRTGRRADRAGGDPEILRRGA